MTDKPNVDLPQIEQVKALAAALEAGDEEEATRLLDDVVRLRETQLFQQLGKLTRDLHEALNHFSMDGRIASLTEKDIPDAKERLNYVITMTEQAANRVLNAIEGVMPITEDLGKRSQSLHQDWIRFRNREMGVEEFRAMSVSLEEFLAWTADNGDKLHSSLNEVLMAQDFQDLTGQVLRRVIDLVQDVEESMVSMLRLTGQRIGAEGLTTTQADDSEAKQKGSGPRVPGVDEAADTMSSQDDVDDLLSSLGF